MEKEKKKELFVEWWNNVPQGKAAEKKEQIIEKCFITSQIFHYWTSGKTEIPDLSLKVIERIAGEKIFKKQKEEA